MDSQLIRTTLEMMIKAIFDKGCRAPEVYFNIEPNHEFRGHVGFHPDERSVQTWAFHRDYSAEVVLSKMWEMIDAIPSLQDRQQTEYLKKLAATIEYGRKIGLEETFINPLELQMKKLSGNIIEHKPESVTPPNLNDELPF